MKIILLGIALMFIKPVGVDQDTKTIKRGGLSIAYPAHWLVRDFPGYLILVSEPEEEQLTVMTTFDIQVNDTFKDVKSFCTNYEEQMLASGTFKNFKIKSKKEINFKGFEAIEYNCTATAQYLPIEWKSIVFMKKSKIYKLSSTSVIGEFFLLRETIDSIFDSFTID